jgi:hypothetical protein
MLHFNSWSRRARRYRRIGLIFAAAWIFQGSSAEPALTEVQAKASVLFNFARYVEWPERAFATPNAPLTFCLAGRDSLSSVQATFEGRTIGGRATAVKRVFGVSDLRGCQVLFVGESEENRLAPMLFALGTEPVLTVSDVAGFNSLGGAIGITLEDGRIQFDINRQALERVNLRASSNLLRLARTLR